MVFLTSRLLCILHVGSTLQVGNTHTHMHTHTGRRRKMFTTCACALLFPIIACDGAHTNFSNKCVFYSLEPRALTRMPEPNICTHSHKHTKTHMRSHNKTRSVHIRNAHAEKALWRGAINDAIPASTVSQQVVRCCCVCVLPLLGVVVAVVVRLLGLALGS